MKNCVLTLVDGVKIVTPDSLALITPYVLVEQNDWFEDEIKFLRKLLKPGQNVIDVGANYGVYTLSMAKTIGSTGSLWAFEPTSSTAALLREGVKTNGFRHVCVEQCALSNRSGTAQLALSDQSEMNSLVHTGQQATNSETVALTTLDESMHKYTWSNIDFMKLYAEGEESNILDGGSQFLSSMSPLIQYEIKVGEEINFNLVEEFERRGYSSYRLVPGLNVLVAFDRKAVPDGYLLNLFCCKKDRADLLSTENLLVKNISSKGRYVKSDQYLWQSTISKLPYGVVFSVHWREHVLSNEFNEDTKSTEALTCYAISQDLALSSTDRFSALEHSFNLFKNYCADKPPSLHLASLARVASEFGAREAAVEALNQLAEYVMDGNKINVKEPFLAPIARFESVSVAPGQEVNWIMASVLEALEKFGAFSSFYPGEAARDRLELIRELGLGDDEMSRRLALLKARFG